MFLTFTFTINPETQEATFAGNVGIQEALGILQQLVIADAIQQAKKREIAKPEEIKTER